MEKLKDIQARGPRNKTEEGYDEWYDEILKAANWEIHGIMPTAIKGSLGGVEMSGEKGIEVIGDWDPINRKWVPAYREVKEELE